MRTLSFINLKGGVAKTTSATSFAYILAAVHGKRVLFIDNDKQGNSSKTFGVHDYERKSISDILTARTAESPVEIIRRTKYEGLDIIPANMGLLKANLDVLLDMSRPQQTRLKKALAFVEDQYDFCIIDHAPDINMANINALVVTDDVLVPVKVDKYAFDGMEILAEQIEEMKDFNPAIRLAGCFLTMFQNYNVDRQGRDWLTAESPYPIFDTAIRKTTKSDQSTFAAEPLAAYAPRCTAAKDYRDLVEEYMRML